MDIYHIIQGRIQDIAMVGTDTNYYPLLFFIISVTVLVAFFSRFFVGIVLRKAIKKEEYLNKKVVKKIKNLISAVIVFLGIKVVLIVFAYSNGILWQVIFKGIVTIFIIYFNFDVMSIGKSVFIVLAHRKGAHFVTQQTLPLFHNLTNIFVVIFVTYITFAFVWGVDMTALLASLGIIGVALSFAAKDTIANFLSGIFIMADQPYQVGDFIDLESGERGEVVDIGIRSTRILTMDDVEIIIPNSIMGNTPVVNESGGPSRKTRIDVDIHVAYGSDVHMVKKILILVAEDYSYVVNDPFPIARFVEFAESGMAFKLLCWIEEASERGQAIDELNTQIYDNLNKYGIEIPYQKHDIYIKEGPKS